MRHLIFVLGIFLLLTSTPQVAISQNSSNPAKNNGWYGSLQTGALVLDDVGFSSNAFAYGLTVDAAGEFSFDPGMFVSGVLGVSLSKFASLESELSYSKVAYDEIKGDVEVFGGGSYTVVDVSGDVDGEVSRFSLSANLILAPVGKQDFSPYFGLGAGIVDIEDRIDEIDTLVVSGKESYSRLMASFIAGFDYGVTGDFDIGLRYRYLWADTGGKGINDATAHALTASLKILF